MFRVILALGFLSTISCVIAEKPEDNVGTALTAYAISAQQNGESKVLKETNLGGQWCVPNKFYCPDGQKCCSSTTCCPIYRKCCGNGSYCCPSSATSARSTIGLIVAALLLYLVTSSIQNNN